MKKFLSIILSILMVVTMLPMSVLPASAASTPTPYDGVPVTPQKISSSNYAKLGLTSSNWSQFNGYYAIRNAKELYGFASIVSLTSNSQGVNAVLLQDIVVNANGGTTYDWSPIADQSNSDAYKGIFDGNGHYISGLYSTTAITRAGMNYRDCGFICNLYGTVKNLVIKNSTFAPGIDIGVNGGLGAITGYPYGCTIQNCRVENITLKSINDGGQLGGIAGYGNGGSSTIKNCVSINVTFSGGIYTNSIAPKAPYSNCYTSATASHNCTNLSVEHKEVKATCEYPGLSNYKYCLVCGKVTSGTKTETPATGHTLKSATCVAPKTCTICGATEGSVDNTAHSWANNDGICANGCGATCAHKNQTGSACKICGAELHVCSNYNNGFCTECDAYEPAELKDGYYQIKNGGNLFWYANYINTVDRTANAVLTADIDLENRPWTPIGSTGENSNNFRGIFDGQNYTIRGLYVEGGRAGLGFFGEVRTGTVKSFTIFGEVVVNTEVDYVGGVIGSICGVNGENDLERNGAIIQNIKSFVNLTAKAHGVGMIGGFVGYANHESLIENCSWYGTFDAGKYRVDSGAGGFIGKIRENTSEVTIRNCGAYGTIKTNYAKNSYNNTPTIYMGGFLSFSNTNAQTTLENCLFAGKFERGENLTDEALLGAFGTLRSVKAIRNCYYLGDDGLEAVHSDSSLKPGSDNVEITKVTEEQLKSGEVAYKLQEANEIWGQSIGTDAYPVLGGEDVYCGYTACDDEAMVYTNDSAASDTKPEHSIDANSVVDNGDGTHSFTCGDCGATVSDNHSGGTATCKTQAVCEVCGTSYGELDPDNHDFGSGNTCICGAEIAFTGIVVDDENSDEYRYDETRKTYTIIIPADEVGGIGYLSYDIIGTNLTLIEDTNTLLKVQHENEDGLTLAPDDLLVDVLQDNGYFGWSVLGYGDGEWEKLLYSNDGGMTWTTYTFEVKQAYSITVNASQNGTVTANEYAIEGDNIALNVSPAEGYMLDTLSVTDASGNSVDVENNAFTMPASAVTVTATFAVCDHKDGRHETATDNGDGTHDATYSCCGAIVAEVPHTLDIITGKCSACGADMTVIATVTDSTNTYYAADAATLNQAVTAILETGSRTFTVELPADTEAEMITAIRRAICDTEGVADGSINLTLKGVTSIPGTTNWDGVAFGPGDIYDEAGEIVDQELVTQLASVNLPDATEIGAQAFYFCENLVAVSAPKAQTIGAQALGYTALTSVEFPELTTIPTDMFSGTWTLSSAKFPKVTT
ncbi:MAG: leucine-rich repeat protein, partial [Clostridia bacterium]|nr:leucine-rich repeat protein [Clostridia bacterium]